ncbi:MAG: hypothetical protein ACE148_09380 [Vicinamibacterales bacterium]
MLTRTTKRGSSKRDVVKNTKEFYAKRDANGRFTSRDRVDRSLAADRRQASRRKVKAGHGGQGDRKRSR